MKRLILYFLFLTLTFTQSWAKGITGQQAQEYAKAFFQARASAVTVKSIIPLGQPRTVYYAINFAPKGWAIVSADDGVTPIIGYSFDGQIDINRLPDNMKFMLDECEQQIVEAIHEEAAPHPRWASPRATVITRAAGNQIEPIIKVNWNQGAPYNAHCPQQKALVGCVAVAMGQAMSVQQYPPRPQGEMSYTSANYGGLRINFDAERAYNWDDIMKANNNSDEIARLLYHAGMSVRMDYGEDASGIPSNEVSRISNALKDYFSYPQTVTYTWQDQYDGDWERLIINELNAGRVVIYNAIDTKKHSGHSFNVDGYDGEGHYHVNWGWGGYGNNYFSINGLRDNYQGYDYDASHVIITGIGAPDQVLKNIRLSNSRIEEGLPANAVVGSVLINGENAKPTYQIEVHGTYDTKTGGYKAVPFRWENNLLKTTETLRAAINKWDIEITVTDTESGTSLVQGFQIAVDAWKSLEETTSIKFDRQTRTLTFKTKHNVSYTLTNENGTVLNTGNLEPLPELSIDANTLPAGKNTIELKCADEHKLFQLISK